MKWRIVLVGCYLIWVAGMIYGFVMSLIDAVTLDAGLAEEAEDA